MKDIKIKKQTSIRLSVLLVFLFVFISVIGIIIFSTSYQKMLWISGTSLQLYGFILLYLFFSKSSISFWDVNLYMGLGVFVWAFPMSLLIMRLSKSVGYFFGMGMTVLGLSVSIFSFWTNKKGIEIA